MTAMQKEILQKIITLILVLLFAFAVSAAIEKVFAQPVLPEGIEVFHVEDMTFVRDVELGKLVYWCTGSCDGCEEEIPIRSLSKATPSNIPTDIPTAVPTTEPTPIPQPTPTPRSAKLPCNRGPGNGPENCDPGNSAGKPGNAGEDNDG